MKTRLFLLAVPAALGTALQAVALTLLLGAEPAWSQDKAAPPVPRATQPAPDPCLAQRLALPQLPGRSGASAAPDVNHPDYAERMTQLYRCELRVPPAAGKAT